MMEENHLQKKVSKIVEKMIEDATPEERMQHERFEANKNALPLDYNGVMDMLGLCDSLERLSRFYKDVYLRLLSGELHLAGVQYWSALASAYQSSDNTYSLRGKIKEMFSHPLEGFETMMDEEEMEEYNSLPNILSIYRGMTRREAESEKYGVSWTLDYKIAETFLKNARNYDTQEEEKLIKEITVKKGKIIAYFNQRKEQEVIVLL